MASPPDSGMKRPRSTPTFCTPVRPLKRQPIRDSGQEQLVLPVARLSLSFGGDAWSEEECRALVEFMMLMTDGDKWPAHKRIDFWEHAGKFVQRRVKSRHLRSGKYLGS